MTTPACIELKAFVPARDFELSKQFYRDLGFTQKSELSDVAYFACGNCAFLLQNFYTQAFAENCVMHLLVADVHDWFAQVATADLAGQYAAHAVCITPLVNQPWGMTEFVVTDPSGVCWHIAQNTPGFAPVGRISD